MVPRRASYHLRHDLHNVCEWVSQNTIGVLTVAETNRSWSKMASAADAYNLPHLETYRACSCDTDRQLIYSPARMEKAVFDYLQEEMLRDVIIIHERGSRYGMTLTELLSSASVRVSHLELTADSKFLKTVTKYFSSWNLNDLNDDGRSLVSLDTSPVIDDALLELIEGNMHKVRTKLLVRDSPVKWMQLLKNVTAYEIDLIVISEEKVSLTQCPVAIEVMPYGAHGREFEEQCDPLPSDMSSFGQMVLSNIKENLNQCCKTHDVDEYTIWKSFPGDEGVQNLRPIAIWSPRGLLRTEMLDFNSLTLRITALEYPPYVVINRTDDGEVYLCESVLKDIVDYLEKKLRFKFRLVTVPDNEWGFRKENYEWTGAIGMLTRGEADIVSFLTTTPRRRKVIDFSMAVTTVPYGILVTAPSEPPRTFIFLRPYRKEVWAATFVVAILMSYILHKTHCLSYLFTLQAHAPDVGLARFFNSLWCMFSALVSQSNIHMPVTVSARMVMATWWLAVLVIVSTYSANLIAFLAFPEARWAVTSLKDLAKHDRMVLLMDEGSSILEDFIRSNQEDFATIRERYFEKGERGIVIRQSSVNVVELVATGKAVFIDNMNHLKRMIAKDFEETGRCRLAIAPEKVTTKEASLGFRRGSSILPIINREIQIMWESGVLSHWKTRHSPKLDECLSVKTTLQGGYDEVELDDMEGAFNMLLLGFATSVAVLTCEVVKKRIKYLKHQCDKLHK